MTPDALPRNVVCNVNEREYVSAMWANLRPRPWLEVGYLLARAVTYIWSSVGS